MSKFDRGVFIFIGLGIWALAMTQVFKPLNVNAVAGLSCTDSDPCVIRTQVVNKKFNDYHFLPVAVHMFGVAAEKQMLWFHGKGN